MPEIEAHPGVDEKRTRELRTRYLEALAAGLGCDQSIVEMSVRMFLESSETLNAIDISTEKQDANPRTNEKIEAIGKLFLAGSGNANEFQYAVGSIVLKLLRSNEGDPIFKNMEGYVDMWTDGRGGPKFTAVLDKIKQ